jgi:phosphatidylinositol kinase/protein kinase (PI-3  family)
VQVFTQDPLYKWSLSPAKIQQLQPLQRRRSDAAESGSAAAASSTSPQHADDRGNASGAAGMGMGGGGGSISSSSSSSSSSNLATVSGGLVEGNSHAHRALIRFQQKLAGQEADGILSVAGQVAKLISDARDPANLCSIFVGWRPWL